ncbi:ABC transporter permease [Acinetobacter ursingii]|uniref:ABC transporter permease n=1 Tax=Acinetobacter ursingii TaxID=108980 RepID=A0AA46S970_9GAMM|nr:ABC transporter permease [Acinetobacter ursingii]MCU4489894.1 ABC transporter permease [Acinetobacter ursingii]MCU4604251.1 ABC transporter permease [Acinetobacter ursingii]MDH2018966.1 ABC transporter permease [Acinetobacter ursingii]MDH2071414.1 ABC transporter permease [Acinetobacter ursingii]UYF76275.1 ABC transporter permease [Acinetobacter ursingii]
MSQSLNLKGALQQPVVVLQGLVLPVILLVLWQYNSGLGSSHAYAFVPLQNIYFAFLQLLETGELWLNTWGSLKKAGLGFLFGSTAGLVLGALLSYSKILNALVSPLFNSIRQVPLLGLTPLIALWFGNGEEAKIFIIALASFFPLVINTFQGLSHYDEKYSEVARMYQFSFWREFKRIRLPQALPHILTGLNLAVPFTWITTTASELLFNAGAGLGNLMMKAEINAEMDILLVCAMTVTMSGILMTTSIHFISKRLLQWRA